MNYVTENLDKSFTLEELAQVANFSPYHFHRVFTAVCGESVNSFTNRVRLEKATRLLRFSKQDSISDIAFQCGFSSPSTFSRSFKDYFETSPSAFRKNPVIQNSKIRKELLSMTEYLVPMSLEEKEAAFPVQVKTLPKRRVAYIRVEDSYQDGVVIGAFEKLIDWARRTNVYNSGTFFGMSIDDPTTTPNGKYRYEVCVTIPDHIKSDADDTHINFMTLPSCKYASTIVSGSFNHVATAIHYLFNEWLINSHYEPEHQHGLEIFQNKEIICDWSYLDLDLCIPVKSLRSY